MLCFFNKNIVFCHISKFQAGNGTIAMKIETNDSLNSYRLFHIVPKYKYDSEYKEISKISHELKG